MKKTVSFHTALIALSLLLPFSDTLAQETDSARISTGMVAEAEKLAGLEFTAEERDSLLDELEYNLDAYLGLREVTLDN